MRAIRQRCEYLENPLGFGEKFPRMQWNVAGGVRQTAYEILAVKNETEIWRSKKVRSGQMYAVYEPGIMSRDRVVWQVRVWDETDTPGPWSEKAFFEAGLLEKNDWKARWICGKDTDTCKRLAPDYYRRKFYVKKPIQKARLYVTAHGVYEFAVNKSRCREAVLAPGTTQYDKRLYYQTYDLMQYLSDEEEQELTFIVGDGWYKGKIGSDNTECFFGKQTQLFAQLELVYQDGSRDTVATDTSFDWCSDGPVRYADLKDGVIYDFSRQPSYGQKALIASEENSVPEAVDYPPMREQEEFTPKLLTTPSGKKVLDFGQNMSGYVRCVFCGKAGQQVTLSLGEVLDQGEFTNENFRDVYGHGARKTVDQQMKFTLSGGRDIYEPGLFYSGFQFALVEGLEAVNPQDFTAVAVYSDLDYESSFVCSNELLNRFVENTVWSQKSNFVDVPTDCPTREKSAWTGDAQVFVKTSLCFADAAAFYRKWMRDIRDCQREDGRIDNVCPKIRGIQQRDALEGSCGWADAAIILPYTLWKFYGDNRFVTDNLDLMLGWMHYEIQAAGDKTMYHLPQENPLRKMIEPYFLPESPYNKYIVETGLHWGEWMEPKDVYQVPVEQDLVRPKQEETTAYLHYSMGVLREMLEAVGKNEEAAVCREYEEGTKKAYHFHFLEHGEIQSNRSCKLVRPLAFGLLDEKEGEKAAEKLDGICRKRQYRIGTGFLSTPFILPILAKYGYLDTAYAMLQNTEEPGWLAMVEQGATSVWEAYNGFDADGHPFPISFNHYSPGAVCSFLFTHICGIETLGERRFLIRPMPGGKLTFAEGVFASPYGKVRSRWEKTSEGYRYQIEIPSNCTAHVELPDGRVTEAAAGKHAFM